MIEKLLYKGTKKLPNTFTDDEINLIFRQILNCKDYWNKKGYKDWGDFFKYRDLCLIATIYLLGLRPKEACCIKFEDLDFRHSFLKIRGENNKVKKDRILPLPKKLLTLYKNYFLFPRLRFWRGSKFLFPSFENSHISSSRLKTIFREKILKPLNIYQTPTENKISKTRLYTLRHTFASNLIKKQINNSGSPDIFAIANLLGHSDIRNTMVYLHTDDNYMEYLREQLNN
jgi:site-specific recombinase XerD